MSPFNLVSPYAPAGDQPEAVASLIEGFRTGRRVQTLEGVTGSGKTFTMANVIRDRGLPTLVLSHNKTLAPRASCRRSAAATPTPERPGLSSMRSAGFS